MQNLFNIIKIIFKTHAAREKNLLIINDQSVSLLSWQQNRFGERAGFANSPQGVQECARHLEHHPMTGAVYILADIQEEALYREELPRILGFNRRNMIQRRLERLFRTTPYCLAESQGRSPSGFERVLFSGLTEPNRIQPWVKMLLQHNLISAGLWSVPLLSRGLLQRATPIRAHHALLISFNAEGQRQTSFLDGRTILSRMIPGPPPTSQAAAMAVIQELEKTRMYLGSLRLVPKETPVHAFIIAPDALTETLSRQIDHTKPHGVTFHLLGTTATAQQLGVLDIAQEQASDLLFGHYLLTSWRGIQGYPLSDAQGARLWASLWAFWSHSAAVPGDTQTPPTRRLGDLLLEKGAITYDQLSIALTEQSHTQQPLGKILVSLGFLTETRMRDLLGGILQHESIDLLRETLDPEAAKIVPKEFAKRHGVIPVAWNPIQKSLVVAMANTLDMATLDRLLARLPHGATIESKLATESEVTEALDRIYGFELSVDGILHEMESGEVDLESLSSRVGEFSHPMVRLVNALLVDAIKHDASDIHFGPMAGFMQIRYRIDGLLRPVRSLHQKFQAGLTVRLKVMCGMDIAETRQPQDGHCSMTLSGRIIDFRASSQPTIHGENIVLRILDRSRRILTLDALGLSAHNRDAIDHMMACPEGIILVTGPTGSGKTTTLYSMIASLNAIERNIMTQEDPVEFPMPSILQTSVNESIQLDFATGIRSILRQDPDIILVGEIRDVETAQMALRAAMTGHQVYSTLHTNSALAAIPRLLNMGLESHTLAGNIIGVLAQRLVRRLCPHCKRPQPLDQTVRQALRLHHDDSLEVSRIYQAVGCPACGGGGFKGRLCVMEALIIDIDFHDLIARSAHPAEFRQAARQKGFQTLWEDGVRHVLDGETSLDEITRILGRS
ncbi:MAG: GspE/PulE family protein [Magnetococcus sp. YQC-5]